MVVLESFFRVCTLWGPKVAASFTVYLIRIKHICQFLDGSSPWSSLVLFLNSLKGCGSSILMFPIISTIIFQHHCRDRIQMETVTLWLFITTCQFPGIDLQYQTLLNSKIEKTISELRGLEPQDLEIGQQLINTIMFSATALVTFLFFAFLQHPKI